MTKDEFNTFISSVETATTLTITINNSEFCLESTLLELFKEKLLELLFEDILEEDGGF